MAEHLFVNRAPDYTDLDLDFLPNPATGDINIVGGEQAIKRSIRNLVFTNFYERKFQSTIGSDVNALLFDLATPLTSVYLENSIKSVINNFEPRVIMNNVTVREDLDNNGYNVTMEYTILNRNLPVISTLFLERIR